MLRVVRADISEQKADAIVNCASSNPTIGAGVESALFAKGKRWLKANREKLGVIEHGHAKISKGGGSLQCKWVIHAVGPYWVDGKSGDSAPYLQALQILSGTSANHLSRLTEKLLREVPG